MFCIFCYTLVNAKYLSQIKPSNSGRHRWVGVLFYDNKNLLILFSLILILLFLSLIVSLSTKLFYKEMTISLIENKLYVNGNYLTYKNNVKNLILVTSKNNSSIYVNLKKMETKYPLNENLLKKCKRRVYLILNKSTPVINIKLVQSKPTDVYLTIKKFIK